MATDYPLQLSTLMFNCLTTAVGLMDAAIRPQEICYRVGSEVAHDADMTTDLCCLGLAYVSALDIWPSSASFPEQDIVRQATAKCMPPAWGFQLKVGIVRCAPVSSDDMGSMPTCTQWTEAHVKTLADAMALQRTACCFRNAVLSDPNDLLGMSVVIERQVQGSPLGGCVERYMNVSVQFPNTICCEG